MPNETEKTVNLSLNPKATHIEFAFFVMILKCSRIVVFLLVRFNQHECFTKSDSFAITLYNNYNFAIYSIFVVL